MVGQTLGHYRVIKKIGEGGMGAVYEAEDLSLQRKVALKFLPAELAADPAAKRRLLTEARAASRLNHPNIATVYEIGESEGTSFIAMELVQGESLKTILQRGAITRTKLCDIARQIAEGLNEAHQGGVLHRDIKPGNIMLDDKGRVKVLDFGLAVFAGKERSAGEAAETFITRTATQWSTGGTVPYMSPEQLLGEPTDARSDVFSFGVLLYECLAGRLPFRGTTSIDTLHAILHQPLTPLREVAPDMPPEWERVVEQCLQKSPERRFRSMQDVLQALPRQTDAPLRTEKSLAVLYFENLSAAKEDEYFRDGMTEDIITELSKIKGLHVYPRATVLAYREKPITAPQVGRELNASYVLTGSVRRAGNRLRITAQLIDARKDFSLWAERYDREMKDVFEVQDEMASKIAQALRITLTPQEQQAIAQKPTENTQAYDCYLRGRSYTRRVTRTDLEFAIEMYEKAISFDSRFALAHAGLALVCALFYEWHEQNPRWIERGLAACEHALALEPQLPAALAARARIAMAQRKYDEAIEYALRAIERKPDSESAYWTLGGAYFCSDRFQEAAAISDRAVEFSGDDYNVYVPTTLALERVGQVESARALRLRQIKALEQQLELVPEDVRARILLAVQYAFFGREAEAARELQIATVLRPKDANILYNAACVYGIMKKKVEALALLKRAKDAGFASIDWAARDPDLACLRDEPEFKSMLGKSAAV
jgi:serine/threonine protein kinase/Tfp pilus assembly protein PilF